MNQSVFVLHYESISACVVNIKEGSGCLLGMHHPWYSPFVTWTGIEKRCTSKHIFSRGQSNSFILFYVNLYYFVYIFFCPFQSVNFAILALIECF